MGSNLGIALLLGLVGAFAIYDYAIGTNYIFRPLVTGVLVGIVMGDVRQGTIIGASLELMFMGAVSVGAYIPPDIVTGGISGNRVCYRAGKGYGNCHGSGASYFHDSAGCQQSGIYAGYRDRHKS